MTGVDPAITSRWKILEEALFCASILFIRIPQPFTVSSDSQFLEFWPHGGARVFKCPIELSSCSFDFTVLNMGIHGKNIQKWPQMTILGCIFQNVREGRVIYRTIQSTIQFHYWSAIIFFFSSQSEISISTNLLDGANLKIDFGGSIMRVYGNDWIWRIRRKRTLYKVQVI